MDWFKEDSAELKWFFGMLKNQRGNNWSSELSDCYCRICSPLLRRCLTFASSWQNCNNDISQENTGWLHVKNSRGREFSTLWSDLTFNIWWQIVWVACEHPATSTWKLLKSTTTVISSSHRTAVLRAAACRLYISCLCICGSPGQIQYSYSTQDARRNTKGKSSRHSRARSIKSISVLIWKIKNSTCVHFVVKVRSGGSLEKFGQLLNSLAVSSRSFLLSQTKLPKQTTSNREGFYNCVRLLCRLENNNNINIPNKPPPPWGGGWKPWQIKCKLCDCVDTTDEEWENTGSGCPDPFRWVLGSKASNNKELKATECNLSL